MPTFEQVSARYRPTCRECMSAQNLRDSFICIFADLLRYPSLQESPARVPRLIAAPLPPPSNNHRPNNRVRASDRRELAERLRTLPQDPVQSPSVGTPALPDRTFACNHYWVGQDAWKNDVDPSLWNAGPQTSPAHTPANDTIVVDNRRHRTNTPRILDQPNARKRKRAPVVATTTKGKGKAREFAPPPPAIQRRTPMVTRSRKGKEKARTPTPTLSPELKSTPPMFDDNDIGAQVAFIDSIASAIPPREIGVGEAGPSTIPAGTILPQSSLVPYSIYRTPSPIAVAMPRDPALATPPSIPASPMPRCMVPSPSDDDEDENLVLQMLLDD